MECLVGRTLGVLLSLTLLAGCVERRSPEDRRSSEDPGNAARDAIQKVLPVLESSAATFVAERSCFSCHHNALPIMTFRMALDRGFEVGADVLGAVEEATFAPLVSPDAFENAVQAVTLSDPTPNDSYLLMAAEAAGMNDSSVTAVLARRLAGWQREGYWVTSDFRTPHSSSPFASTASAVRAIRRYMPVELADQRQASLAAARRWLAATRPASTEDAAFRLMGLVWADATASEIDAAREDLLGFRKPSGGWSQTDRYDADAYSTGEALIALGESGLTGEDPARRAGIEFLISTQADDGTWHVRTRMLSPAMVSPPYFSTGFPYEDDEFLSYAGSCWAVMALLAELPETGAGASDPPGVDAAPAPESWVRTALFGTREDLAVLLEGGLDPDSRTADGTTLLMMAVPDAARVGLLLDSGADATLRSRSGNDALTLATSYYGSAPVVAALIEAGVPSEPPAGVRVGRLPLVFAAMTGDRETVGLLLDAGADPSSGAPVAAEQEWRPGRPHPGRTARRHGMGTCSRADRWDPDRGTTTVPGRGSDPRGSDADPVRGSVLYDPATGPGTTGFDRRHRSRAKVMSPGRLPG